MGDKESAGKGGQVRPDAAKNRQARQMPEQRDE
jgi:hypothetical protein